MTTSGAIQYGVPAITNISIREVDDKKREKYTNKELVLVESTESAACAVVAEL